MKYPKTHLHNGYDYKGKRVKNTIIYVPLYWSTGIIGIISLPDGWQDMDRTWTAQDISWITIFDCLIAQGRALLKRIQFPDYYNNTVKRFNQMTLQTKLFENEEN